ncbi:MAG: Ycf51 family protein [Cyanobacteriota bacterium]|nr:Ycf51 family protein [Cyanobacteriota bacterium]
MTTSSFALGAEILGILTLLLMVITMVVWWRQLAWRFAMVGYTGFALVLTVGCFALSVQPIMPATLSGSVRYTTVYDRGTEQAVIAVDPSITPEQLDLTLRQAAQNLLSSGRYSTGSPLFTLRARTVLHPAPDYSLPLYLGQLQQPLVNRRDPNPQVEIFAAAFEQLSPT